MSKTTNSNPYQIQVRLFKNQMKRSEESAYYARVKALNTINTKQICEQAVKRGGSNMSASNMEQAVEEFFKEMAYKLASGLSVNTGYFTATAAVKGSFKTVNDNFDKEKHSMRINLTQGEKLRSELENSNITVLGPNHVEYNVNYLFDYTTERENACVTSGKNIKLQGKRIRVAGDDESVGVYFTNIDTDVVTKIPSKCILENNPGSLIILMPELEPGSYTIEIKTQYASSGRNLKSVVSMEYPNVIEVLK